MHALRHRGSSPRGRGKLVDYVDAELPGGLIPARAGKTGRSGSPACLGPAHPRAGGENGVNPAQVTGAAGSSPRGRGKRGGRVPRRRPCGLIPARAGKTAAYSLLVRRSAAHPRAGGENSRIACASSTVSGSSPRGRGKRGQDGREAHASGLIPARAGKTHLEGVGGAGAAAHPRAGGENLDGVGGWVADAGSSPRGRGKPCRTGSIRRCLGLIPARAGKTAASTCRPLRRTAHPRAGGENPQA